MQRAENLKSASSGEEKRIAIVLRDCVVDFAPEMCIHAGFMKKAKVAKSRGYTLLQTNDPDEYVYLCNVVMAPSSAVSCLAASRSSRRTKLFYRSIPFRTLTNCVFSYLLLHFCLWSLSILLSFWYVVVLVTLPKVIVAPIIEQWGSEWRKTIKLSGTMIFIWKWRRPVGVGLFFDPYIINLKSHLREKNPLEQEISNAKLFSTWPSFAIAFHGIWAV